MKKLLCAILVMSVSSAAADDWKPLLDEKLSQWEVWTGVPHTSLDVKWEHKADNPKDGKPMGLGDHLNSYTVKKAKDGSLELFISGKIYAGLTTLKTYGSYHLRAEVKWDGKKWEPRLDRPRDSGILYHCQGEHGTFWNVWKKSLEYQVQENDNGDYFKIGAVSVEVPVKPTENKNRPIYDPKGKWTEINKGMYSAQRSENHEKEGGWNLVEIIVVGNRAVHLSNGKVVNVLRNAKHKIDDEWLPLIDGQIQIQSEGADVTYRKFEIREIAEFPKKYAKLFGDSK